MGVTIKDIAKEANVSATTVSRVLNNKPGVSIKTKKKIEHLIEVMGYNPNSVARGLVLNKTYTIGLIIPDISNPFFPEMARGVEDKATELGYSVVYYNTDKDKREEKRAIALLRSKQVDGIIVSFFSRSIKKELKKLEEMNYPVVRVDSNLKKSIYPSVTIDSVSSAYRATEYLINMGHRKIGHMTGKMNSRAARHLLVGYKNCLRKYGLEFCMDWIIEGDFTKESGYHQMKKILQWKEKPTAIFFANDLMAIGAYKALYEMGYKVPDDISIIGHDDIEFSSYIIPPLTTMKLSEYNLGYYAADILIKSIENKEGDIEESIILHPELIERASVRKIK